MSTTEMLDDHIAKGELFEWTIELPYPSQAGLRRLVVTQEAWQWCSPSGASSFMSEEQLALARAALTDFIYQPWLEEDQDVKHLDPYELEVFEVKATGMPKRLQTRLFGWFTAPAIFVGVHWKHRKGINFAAAIKKVVSKREVKFPSLPVLGNMMFQDYVG